MKTKFIVDKSDGSPEQKNHPHYTDLMLSVYNEQPDASKSIPLEAQKDDSNYDFLKTLESAIDLWLQDPSKKLLIPYTKYHLISFGLLRKKMKMGMTELKR